MEVVQAAAVTSVLTEKRWLNAERYFPRRKPMENSLKQHMLRRIILVLSPPFAITTEMLNMERPYGSEWQVEEKVKHREMVAPEARYIFVRKVASSNANEMTTILTAEKASTSCLEDSGPLVGFVQYRFIVEEEIPVLYVYELQLEPCVQGKGLGKFLMQLIELIARKVLISFSHLTLIVIKTEKRCKNSMGGVMLTVQKANLLAMNFYISKLRYIISTMSPSRVNPVIGVGKSYEILCRTFDDEAKTILEDQNKFGEDCSTD